VALHDERRATGPEERCLVRRPRAVRRRDRMAEDHEGVRRLLGREERAHPPAEGPADQRDGRARAGDELVARGAQLPFLGRIAGARPLRRERDARRGDAVGLEALRQPFEERLLRGAAVAGGQDRGRHVFAGALVFAGAAPVPPRVFFAGAAPFPPRAVFAGAALFRPPAVGPAFFAGGPAFPSLAPAPLS